VAGVSEVGLNTTIKVWRGRPADAQDEGSNDEGDTSKVCAFVLVCSSL
jgi:hypothetical protein